MEIDSYIFKLRAQFITDTGKDPDILMIHGEPARDLQRACQYYTRSLVQGLFTPTIFQGMTVISQGLTGDFIGLGIRYPYDPNKREKPKGGT